MSIDANSRAQRARRRSPDLAARNPRSPDPVPSSFSTPAALDRRQRELARDLVPQILTFAGRSSGLAQVYRSADQALRESLDNARFMRNDPAIMECLEARQRAVALLPWRIEAEDASDPRAETLVRDMTAVLNQLPRFTEYRRNLLEALWYGRYANQHLFGWSQIGGKKRVAIQDWRPINGDKLVFRWDDGTRRYVDGQIGIRVSSQTPRGSRLDGRLVEQTDQGLAFFLEPWERCRLTVHRHIIEDGSYEDAMSAGRIHGVGIRDRIYWSWFQKQESMAQLMEVIERTGTGFTIYYYPAGNPHAKIEVRELAERQSHTNVVLMPRLPGDPTNEGFGIERIEPSTAGIDALKQIVHDFFNHQIKRYILGQTLSSESDNTGLGSGVADLHQNTFAQIVEYDAIKLAETLTQETLLPLKNFNFPKLRDIPLRLRLITKSEDPEQKLKLLKTAWDMGAKIDPQEILALIGAKQPKEGEAYLCNPALQKKEERSDEEKSPDPIAAQQYDDPQTPTGPERYEANSTWEPQEHPRQGEGADNPGWFASKDQGQADGSTQNAESPEGKASTKKLESTYHQGLRNESINTQELSPEERDAYFQGVNENIRLGKEIASRRQLIENALKSKKRSGLNDQQKANLEKEIGSWAKEIDDLNSRRHRAEKYVNKTPYKYHTTTEKLGVVRSKLWKEKQKIIDAVVVAFKKL